MASHFLPDLPEADHLAVMRHPAQQHNVGLVESLVTWLRMCRSAPDYDDFQRGLFQHLHRFEDIRAQGRRCAARLARGKSLSTPLPPLPDGADPHDPRTWRVEDLVFERVCRQLRAVGDALAWRASGYDRRYVIALSSNNAPGPMAGKKGLPRELGAAVSLRDQGSFGLLHDLTNCLRIGDVTEFTPDGSRLLHEIKSSQHAKSGAQRRRMKAAVQAVMHGGELPGRTGSHIVSPDERCRTHIRTFASCIADAADRGIAATAISDSRAMTAASLEAIGRTQRDVPARSLLDDLSSARHAALEKAGIAAALHLVQANSVTRNHDFLPSVMPFALYPIPPSQAALLICDGLFFDIAVSPERISGQFERLGVHTEIPLAPAHDTLVAGDAVINLRRGTRRMQLHPGALYEFLMESLDLETWAAAIAQVLDDRSAPRRPVVALTTTRVWR